MAPAFLLCGVFCSSLLKSATRSKLSMRDLMRFGGVVVIFLIGEVPQEAFMAVLKIER